MKKDEIEKIAKDVLEQLEQREELYKQTDYDGAFNIEIDIRDNAFMLAEYVLKGLKKE